MTWKELDSNTLRLGLKSQLKQLGAREFQAGLHTKALPSQAHGPSPIMPAPGMQRRGSEHKVSLGDMEVTVTPKMVLFYSMCICLA